MAKFTFPLPGRSKKQQPAAAPQAEPMSKAQRVLGSAHISIDSKRQWDDRSTSGISVSVSESTAPTANSSSRGVRRREWGDESDILPSHLLRVDEDDGAPSDYTSNLREQPSSSTIKSWYDRTTQPLSVSQQTSASAMAKGPPSKAQRLLDMDNKHTPPAAASGKSKKKPAMLDLSMTKPGERRNDWDGPVLGNEYVTRSPSILSPLTPGGTAKRPRRKIQKRPTHESLRRQQEQDEKSRPGTSGSETQPNSGRHDDLPSLYKHYEQMSFAQMMDEEDEVKEVLKPERYQPPDQQERLADVDETLPSTTYPSRSYRRDEDRGPLSSHPTLVSHSTSSSYSTQRTHPTPLSHPTYTQHHPTQVVHAPTPTKSEHSMNDYAASVSSRHTRTSKASKRTEKSFQTADLQEKSVLILSSDSEEDDEDVSYDENRDTISAAPTPRRSSLTESQHDTQGTMLDDASSTARDSTLTATTVNRMSSAPAGFLTIPTHVTSKSPSSASSTSSGNFRESSQWPAQPTFHIPASPSDASLSTTVSSASTAMTWQEREGYGVQEARAVTMVPAQGPDEPQSASDSELEYENPRSVVRDSQAPPATAAEPTPPMSPLSPSSMEFYIDNPQPMTMAETHEHMMGLTRQEQMLIQALRQRRETMRQNGGAAPADVSRGSSIRGSQRGHRSNPSEATITESTFNFGFPAPPSNKKNTTSAQSSMVDLPIPGHKDDEINDREPSCTADGTLFVLSPPPTHHKTKSIANSIRESRSTGSIRHSVQKPYADVGVSRDDAGQAPLERKQSRRSPPREPLTAPKPRASLRRPRVPADRERGVTPERSTPGSQAYDHWAIAEDEPTILPQRSQNQYQAQQHPARQPSMRSSAYSSPRRSYSRQQESRASSYRQEARIDEEDVDDVGIPRPDSPISPMAEAFPAVPVKRRTQLNPGARLSAFGPPQSANGEFGWWGDED